MKTRTWFIVLLLAAGACGGDDATTTTVGPTTSAPTTNPSPTTVAPDDCSASDHPGAAVLQAELPVAVALTRAELVAAAAACDYEGLERKAFIADDFSYSFGEVGDPASFWLDLESQGEPVLKTLADLLNTPPAQGGEVEVDNPSTGPTTLAVWVWPTAFAAETPTDADWANLEGIYTAEEIEQFRVFGYLGYRVGIREDGAWLFYVAGD